jgi:signal transduction histidine kinase
VGLYRIVQEGLNNIRQHAEASQVRLQLLVAPRQVRLIIEDNGRGFEPTEVPPGRFGVIGLNERV